MRTMLGRAATGPLNKSKYSTSPTESSAAPYCRTGSSMAATSSDQFARAAPSIMGPDVSASPSPGSRKSSARTALLELGDDAGSYLRLVQPQRRRCRRISIVIAPQIDAVEDRHRVDEDVPRIRKI